MISVAILIYFILVQRKRRYTRRQSSIIHFFWAPFFVFFFRTVCRPAQCRPGVKIMLHWLDDIFYYHLFFCFWAHEGTSALYLLGRGTALKESKSRRRLSWCVVCCTRIDMRQELGIVVCFVLSFVGFLFAMTPQQRN